MIILYDNKITDATITASSENPLYPFDDAFADDRLSRVGRTVSATSQTLVFDFASGNPEVDAVAILGHNISASGSITVEANTSNSWGSPAFTDTLDLYDEWIALFANTQEYRYWRLSITDPGSTDGYIEIGQIYIGSQLDMPPMIRNQKLPKLTSSTSQKSVNGQLYGDRRLMYRTGSIQFAQAIPHTYKTNIDTFFSTVETIKPFILIVWEESMDKESPMYCCLTKQLEWSRYGSDGLLWDLSIEVEECF